MSDYIDRQAAIDAIGSYILSFTAIDRNYYEGLRDAKRLLNDIPSAEVEPVKRGKWIYDNQFHWYRASCSECGYKRVTDIKAEKWNGWKYCPNCGAKMEPIPESPENGQEAEE